MLRDWKHSFTVMLWGFVLKPSGEEDILGTLRLLVWWKVSDSGKAPHSAKHRKMLGSVGTCTEDSAQLGWGTHETQGPRMGLKLWHEGRRAGSFGLQAYNPIVMQTE